MRTYTLTLTASQLSAARVAIALDVGSCTHRAISARREGESGEVVRGWRRSAELGQELLDLIHAAEIAQEAA